MNDSGRPADLFRRILRQTSSAMPPASPSSVFLVPTKNLSREQGVPRQHSISPQQPIHLSMRYTCFGWVPVNYPGWVRGESAQSVLNSSSRLCCPLTPSLSRAERGKARKLGALSSHLRSQRGASPR